MIFQCLVIKCDLHLTYLEQEAVVIDEIYMVSNIKL